MASSSQPTQPQPSQPNAAPNSANADTTGVRDETRPKKKQRQTKSLVWGHFRKNVSSVIVDGKVVKTVTAICKGCSREFVANSADGTTRLWNHYRAKHEVRDGQKVLNSAVENFKYDENVSRKKLALAIVMHEYPFRMVEHEYFIDFVKSLRPSFPLKSRATCRKEILEMYNEERDKVCQSFESLSGRLSATMDLWTSRQNKSYMCITVHFIDDNWNIQKRIVCFMRLCGRHSGLNLSQAVMKSLFDWKIDKKMFSITLDNDGANRVCVRDMVTRLNENNGLCCAGKFFHVRCAAHIINLVVQDGISMIKNATDGIREIVGKVKHSPILREEFEQRAKDCKLDTSRALSLDVSTRWNSTYMMLRDAIYYKEAFERMRILNPSMFPKFPTIEEWRQAMELCKLLKNFHAITELLSGTSYPTSNLFFKQFCEIKLKIEAWLKNENATIVTMANSMKQKLDKYWDQSNIVLAIASFLDSRCKMGLIEFYYPKIYNNGGAVELIVFNQVLRELYGEYSLRYSLSEVIQSGERSMPGDVSGNISDDEEDGELSQFLLERSQPWNTKSDLDQYLERPPTACPKGQPFEVLRWWETEGKEYHILSKIARDVLAVPVSTVASESAFSTGGRVVNPYRSKLDSKAVEALVCIQDWIRGHNKGGIASIYDFVEEVEAGEVDELEEEEVA